MLGVFDLLKNPTIPKIQKFHRWLQILFQNTFVLISFHNALNKNQPASARCRYSSPKRNAPTASFTVDNKFSICIAVFLLLHITARPSLPNIMNFDSSVNKTLDQKSFPLSIGARVNSSEGGGFFPILEAFYAMLC